MINDILENYGLYICIGLGVLVLIVAIILIVNMRKGKEVEEDNSSILDVNIDGVVDKEFKYGYEKQDTVVVKKEDLKKESKEKKEEN